MAAYDFSHVCGSSNAVLNVTADNAAWIFHNGVHLGDVHDWPQNFQKQLTVHVNDRGGGYGVVADLIAFGQHCVTKPGRGPWRAMSLDQVGKKYGNLFKAPSSNAKAEKKLGFPTAAYKLGRSSGFPFQGGAEYVWAKGAGEHSTIFIRLEVTDNCAANK